MVELILEKKVEKNDKIEFEKLKNKPPLISATQLALDSIIRTHIEVTSMNSMKERLLVEYLKMKTTAQDENDNEATILLHCISFLSSLKFCYYENR